MNTMLSLSASEFYLSSFLAQLSPIDQFLYVQLRKPPFRDYPSDLLPLTLRQVHRAFRLGLIHYLDVIPPNTYPNRYLTSSVYPDRYCSFRFTDYGFRRAASIWLSWSKPREHLGWFIGQGIQNYVFKYVDTLFVAIYPKYYYITEIGSVGGETLPYQLDITLTQVDYTLKTLDRHARIDEVEEALQALLERDNINVITKIE